MSKAGKKDGRSFSMTEPEWQQFMSRAAEHGFENRNEYLFALMEADCTLDLRPVLEGKPPRTVLRPPFYGQMVADQQAAYEAAKKGKSEADKKPPR